MQCLKSLAEGKNPVIGFRKDRNRKRRGGRIFGMLRKMHKNSPSIFGLTRKNT
jgi:hypothetical protein